MIPKRMCALCQNKISVSSELAKDPEATPRDVVARFLERADGQFPGEPRSEKLPVPDSKDLEVAFQCGKWGSQRPSDLFLKIYQDALCSLAKDLMSGLVSPSLMGSCGVVPMTIIGPLPDICRHMSNCIVRAEKEVILMTSYWIYSDNSRFLTNAMRELSHRAGLRGTKVVIKLMYDRGNLKQFLNNRQPVCAKQVMSSKIQLPGPQEIPNIDLQVLNYHRPVAGTLHSKFMIVDRKVALLESNNIQDNDNLEMMVRFEGPIVDSFYDMALISWSVALNPPLPLIDTPAASMVPPSYPFLFTNHGRNDSVWSSQGDPTTIYAEKPEDKLLPEHTPDEPHYDADIVAETARITASLTPRPEETRRDCVTRHLNIVSRPDITGDAPEWDEDDHMTPYILHPPHEPFPMAMVNREPWGALNHSSIYTPQNAAFLAAIGNAEHSVFIQTPNLNAERLLTPLLDAVRRGVIVTCFLCLGYNDAGQLLPFQNGINEMTCNRLYNSLSTNEDKSRLRIYNYVGKDQTRPIHNKFKKRSCHIKLMIIDEKVAIQGSANLDTQSFFHSQETNVLLDSPLICRSWLDALCRNQNTATYGAVSKVDGCWHDPETGEIAVGSIGTDPGRFSWMRGIVGAIKRVRGVGGF
ncbi:phospholipase D [Coccidioides posadasii str. Silveira]|uniref:Phospholipase D n=2 Tax=Coccidioides posadasii (strain RMSCC 757 / Silveira) TaxID=443226 RepID=E9DFL5_COCPS|nr:phospholipase D [Coccidioides posadasii str. Silveira]